jgi:hypothetical protein
MIFKMLKGFDAQTCATHLYNAGLFNFGYPPRFLSVLQDWVIVMSRVDPGPLNPQQREAFGLVIQAAAQQSGDVIVRDTPGQFEVQGTIIPVTAPPAPSAGAPGIVKYLSGANAGDCAARLSDSYLIAGSQPAAGSVRIASRPELDPNNAVQAADFDFVVKAVAAMFTDAAVSDEPPGSI